MAGDVTGPDDVVTGEWVDEPMVPPTLRGLIRGWLRNPPRSYANKDGAEYGYDVARREIELLLAEARDGG